MIVLTKPVLEAILDGMEMYWQSSGGFGTQIELLAVTWSYENGTIRTRRLWRTYSPDAARAVDALIRDNKGVMIGRSLDYLLETLEEDRQAVERSMAGALARGGSAW